MYLSYWGLKEKPFENTPDPKFIYYSVKHKEAMLNLFYVVNENKGAALLTGHIGCGKTLIARTLISQLDPKDFEVALITNPWLDEDDFFREILYQFGIETDSPRRIDILHKFNDFLYSNAKETKKSVLIIDEAQLIKNDNILEEIRLLLNFQLNDRFLLTLVLIGQAELEQKLRNMPQLDQRISIRYYIDPLSAEDTYNYIRHRLKHAGKADPIFTDKAVDYIFEYSQGIPRKINNICDMSLIVGMMEKIKLIDDSILKKVVEDVTV